MLFLDSYLRHFYHPSLQESGNTPESKTALKMSQINGNDISIVSIKYSFKRQSIPYALLDGQIPHLRNYR